MYPPFERLAAELALSTATLSNPCLIECFALTGASTNQLNFRMMSKNCQIRIFDD